MIEVINADNDGNARTLMSHYHKDGCRNLLTAIWGGQDEVMFLDIYNKNYNGKTFGAILTGVDFRGLHYLMEYETDKDR